MGSRYIASATSYHHIQDIVKSLSLSPQSFASATNESKIKSIKTINLVGRSNVGKSSLMNRLLLLTKDNNGEKARASKSPGRTQKAQIFQVSPQYPLLLIDLPGYGYAKVPKDVAAQMAKTVSSIAIQDPNDYNLGTLVLIDSRRGELAETTDLQMIQALVESNHKFQIILTKIDCLKSENEVQDIMMNIFTTLENKIGKSALKKSLMFPDVYATSAKKPDPKALEALRSHLFSLC